jgi:hypothetical protein
MLLPLEHHLNLPNKKFGKNDPHCKSPKQCKEPQTSMFIVNHDNLHTSKNSYHTSHHAHNHTRHTTTHNHTRPHSNTTTTQQQKHNITTQHTHSSHPPLIRNHTYRPARARSVSSPSTIGTQIQSAFTPVTQAFARLSTLASESPLINSLKNTTSSSSSNSSPDTSNNPPFWKRKGKVCIFFFLFSPLTNC